MGTPARVSTHAADARRTSAQAGSSPTAIPLGLEAGANQSSPWGGTVSVLSAQRQAAGGAAPGGTLLIANQPRGARPLRDVGILYPAGASRRSIQNSEGRLGDPPDPSSEGETDRSAYLRGLPGLCPPRDVASAFAGSGARINPTFCLGKVWVAPDDKCPSPDHGRPQGNHVAVHPARAGPPNVVREAAVV